jgi:hypothetical protein
VLIKSADPVLPNDEHALWDSGVFNIDLSTGLSYIVFFYNCNFFCFRASLPLFTKGFL